MASTVDHARLADRRSGWEEIPPAWAMRLVQGRSRAWQPAANSCAEDVSVRVIAGDRFAVVSARVRGAVSLSAAAFQRATTTTYNLIGDHLRQNRVRYPVRLWNLIPGILQPLDRQPHRYMAFNAGRYDAYLRWFSTDSVFDRMVPTASGVGYPGRDLVVHCLAAPAAGEPVENPRQVSSYRYSERYGSLPPCFARATRLTGPPDLGSWLLVGGTASVRGEDTMHVDDLRAQSDETFANLASLVSAGAQQAAGATQPAAGAGREREALACYRHLRVYYVRQHDLPIISRLVEKHFSGLESTEYLQADLCRPKLLIEIEGVAQLPSR